MDRLGRKLTLSVSLLAVVASGFGCSYTFSEGPPAQHALMPYFDCTSTSGLAVADGFFALSGVAGAITVFQKSKQEYADDNKGANRNVAGGVNIATAALFGSSAIYGIVQSERCRRAKTELEARLLRPMLPLRRPPAPPTGVPPTGIPFAPSPASGLPSPQPEATPPPLSMPPSPGADSEPAVPPASPPPVPAR